MATSTSTKRRASVSGLAVWRLSEDLQTPVTDQGLDRVTRAIRPHVTGWAFVSWPTGRPAPRVVSTGPSDGALDPSCWHLVFGGMLLAPLLDIRSGVPFRDPPPRRQEIDVFVNQVRDLVVPGSCVVATVGPVSRVRTAADAIYDALGSRSARVGTTITLADREAAVVADVFLEPGLTAASR